MKQSPEWNATTAVVDPMRDASAADLPPPRRSKRRVAWVIVLLLLLIVAVAWWWSRGSPAAPDANANRPYGKGAGANANANANRAVPVLAVAAAIADLPVRLTALGTVTALNTVTVRARVDGQLIRINFKEGDNVKAGQVLAEIDPRPFQVQVQQAEGQLTRDKAVLLNAQNDLKRYQTLLTQDSVAAQQVDNQESLVRQNAGVVASDEGALASARLQLSFARVQAPVSGRIGLRQVDVGNIVHSSDTNGLIVITQVQPISVVFPLPQDNLPALMKRLGSGGQLVIDAYDRDGVRKLANSTQLTVDNVIDTTSGTVKVKAQFPNENNALFPNQFVNVRLQVDTLTDAVVVPSAAVQRGAPGLYVYVVQPDSTVTVRVVKVIGTDGDRSAIGAGLKAGEQVVIDGSDKLREGAKVEVSDPAARAAATQRPPGAAARGNGPRGERKHGGGDGTGAGNVEHKGRATLEKTPPAASAPDSPASSPAK